MGTDCTMAVEINNGAGWCWLGKYEMERNYSLFSRLSDVRNGEDLEFIHEPRGLPIDCDKRTREFIDWNCDHSVSWFTLEEGKEFFERFEEYDYNDHSFYAFFKFLISAYWSLPGIVDIRLVYGFDS